VANEMCNINMRFFSTILPAFSEQNKIFITPKMSRFLESEIRDFDIIHLHEYRTYQNILVHRSATKFNVPYVLHAHGGLFQVPKRQLKSAYDFFWGKRLLADASAVIALSPIETQQFKNLGVKNEKIRIIPNGIDLSEFENLPPKGDFRRRFSIPEQKQIILFIGRINRDKGIDFLLSAFACLVGTKQYDDSVLVIAGRDDGYLNTIKKLVKTLGIEDKTLLVGSISDKQKIEAYVDASIFVSPDKENVFLLVPLESIACRTPVIVTASNSISSYVKEGKFGESIHYGRITELSSLLERMLSDQSQLKEMGLKGRNYVFKNFRWADKIDMLERVYEDIIEQKNKC
jgi:glycosyltransferase involved in cell wall biosynthesis